MQNYHDQLNAVGADSWYAYLADVQRRLGRTITDGPTIDMLYALYLGDIPAEQAVGNMEGLQHASVGVQRALDNIQAAKSSRDLEMAYKDVRSALGWRGKGRIIRRDTSDLVQFMPQRHGVPDWGWCVGAAAGGIIGAGVLAAVMAYFQ